MATKRIRNPEERSRAQKKYYLKTRESRKAIRAVQYARWLEKNPNYFREYCKNNKSIMNAQTAKRRAAKLRATPSWLSAEQIAQMKEIYKNCPKGYQVDHIEPLRGKDRRGLHVPWNLQYLTKVDNLKKGNRA